ncbi:MAG: hypothetical protein ACP5XB_00220 [Isosphaeraceae bacterium]
MLRKFADPATIELLRSLREPVELCNETGEVLGTFTPEPAELVTAAASTPPAHPWEAHENLGAELDVFGYEHDID